jgi:hypothetical protein
MNRGSMFPVRLAYMRQQRLNQALIVKNDGEQEIFKYNVVLFLIPMVVDELARNEKPGMKFQLNDTRCERL